MSDSVASSAPVTSTATTTASNTPSNTPVTDTKAVESTEKPLTPAEVRKLKLKIDGQELELPEAEVIARAQRSSAADKRFQEAQMTKKQAEAFINALRTDFTKLIDDPSLGIADDKKQQMIEDYYRAKYIEPQLLTPEQQQQKKMEAELKRYRDQEESVKRQQHEEHLKMLEQHHVNNYQQIIIKALNTEGLPKTEYTTKRMADLMSKNLQMGLDLTPEHLAQLVREDYVNEQKSLFSATDGDTLLKLMGEDVVNKIRKADLARLKAGIPKVPEAIVDTAKANQESNARRTFKSMDEERAEREERVKALTGRK